jgi:hypothetical protein
VQSEHSRILRATDKLTMRIRPKLRKLTCLQICLCACLTAAKWVFKKIILLRANGAYNIQIQKMGAWSGYYAQVVARF